MLECAFNVSEIICDAAILRSGEGKLREEQRCSHYSETSRVFRLNPKLMRTAYILCCYAALHIKGLCNCANLSHRLLVVTDGIASRCLKEKRKL